MDRFRLSRISPRGHDARRHMKKRGFTLIELLVVIGIIAVLVALLMPALARARWEAKIISCASTERQYVMSLQMYADDNKGVLPRFDGSTGADNPHDLTLEYYDMLLNNYGMVHVSFFCPLTSDDVVDTLWNAGFLIQGYELWIQRSSGVLFPPDPGTPGFTVVGTDPIRGPSKIGDPLALTNPILTDDIYLYPGAVGDPVTFNVSQAPATDFYQIYSSHLRMGQLDSDNEAYLDGHVERVPAGSVKCVYLSGNAWVCR